jgi:Fe-S cluster assembly iron-binding protein IscA
MLNVTDKAAASLKESLELSRQEESHVLRLTPRAEGFGLALDEEREGDQVVVYEESRVLLIQPDLSQELDGATVDLIDTPEGGRLIIKSA